MLCFVLIAEFASDTSPLAAQVTPAWLDRCAAALTKDLNENVARFWPDAKGAVVRRGSSPADVGPGEIACGIVPTTPVQGAVAYHDFNGNAVPFVIIALDMCSSLDDLSIAISHEIDETAGDAACNLWADDAQGHEWAREVCDAVESNSYPIDLGDGGVPIRASDFLLPPFFAPNAVAPFCFLAFAPQPGEKVTGTPGAPRQTAGGGYQIQRQSGQGEAQVVAHADSRRGARALRGAHSWSSRTARRGVATKSVSTSREAEASEGEGSA